MNEFVLHILHSRTPFKELQYKSLVVAKICISLLVNIDLAQVMSRTISKETAMFVWTVERTSRRVILGIIFAQRVQNARLATSSPFLCLWLTYLPRAKRQGNLRATKTFERRVRERQIRERSSFPTEKLTMATLLERTLESLAKWMLVDTSYILFKQWF